jgi:hypothetical protein
VSRGTGAAISLWVEALKKVVEMFTENEKGKLDKN